MYADPQELRDVTFFMPKPAVPRNKKPMNQQGFKPPKPRGGGFAGGRGGARGGFRGAPRGGGFRGGAGGRGGGKGALRGGRGGY